MLLYLLPLPPLWSPCLFTSNGRGTHRCVPTTVLPFRPGLNYWQEISLESGYCPDSRPLTLHPDKILRLCLVLKWNIFTCRNSSKTFTHTDIWSVWAASGNSIIGLRNSNRHDGARLCLCWTAIHNGHFVHPPDDTWVNMEQQWNDTDRGNRRTRRETCPSATLSATNRTWPALGANLGLRDE
jgi:hypothetical protein